jgi:hypothetical protein
MTTDEVLCIPTDLQSPTPRWKGKDQSLVGANKGNPTQVALISCLWVSYG